MAATTNTISVTTNDANVASGSTLNVNASALTSTSANFTFNGSAENNGSFSVTGGAGADTITGGFVSDTISGGAGADSIVGGSGADSLTGGEGQDTINGGAGLDTVVFTETTSVADTYYWSGATANSNIDTIIGFTAGTDILDITALAAFLNTTTEAVGTFTSPNGAGTANDNILVLNFGTYYADGAAVLAALGAGDVTLGSGIASASAHVLVVYQTANGSNLRIADATVADAGGFTAVQDLVILSGVTTFTGLTAASFTLD